MGKCISLERVGKFLFSDMQAYGYFASWVNQYASLSIFSGVIESNWFGQESIRLVFQYVLKCLPTHFYMLFSSVIEFFCIDLAVTLWVPNYNFDSRCRCVPSWCCYFNWFILCALAWSVERNLGLWTIWVVILSQSYRFQKRLTYLLILLYL